METLWTMEFQVPEARADTTEDVADETTLTCELRSFAVALGSARVGVEAAWRVSTAVRGTATTSTPE